MRLSVWLSWIVPHVWVSPSFNWTMVGRAEKVPTQRQPEAALKIFGKMPITGRPTPRNSLMD
jgi:hypothetical protein